MSILIVDDDPRFTANLAAFIEWEALGFAAPQIAGSGEEAIEKVANAHIDVVLTDISMPGMDGLDLIRRLRRLAEHIEFIILSGYGTFDYARSAIGLRVKHFLVKPTDLDELTAALHAVRVEIENRLAADALLRSHESMVSQTLTDALDQMFADLRMGRLSPSLMKHLLTQLDARFAEGRYCLLRVRLTSPADRLDEASRRLQMMMRLTAGRLGIRIYCIPSSSYNQFALINFDDDSLPQRFVFDVSEAFCAMGEHPLRSGLSAVAEDFEHLADCFEQANRAAIRAISHGELLCVCPKHEVSQASSAQEKADALVAALMSADPSEQMRLLAAQLDPRTTAGEAVCLVLEVVRRLKAVGETANVSWCAQDAPAPFELAPGAPVNAWLRETLLHLLQDMKSSAGSVNARAVERAKAFIQQQFMDDVSLEQVARHVNMSPNYFSRVFSELAGIRFIDYVTAVRVTKSLEWLLDDTIPVYDVSERVGYRNPKYFSQVFRAAVGCTPTEFRQRSGHAAFESGLSC